jgi:hypothetical protein
MLEYIIIITYLKFFAIFIFKLTDVYMYHDISA